MTETDAPLVRAALPRGFADRDQADIAAAEAMMAKIREVYALYGFEAVETPFVEFTEALGKFLPDQDRPNEGVFSFKDDDGVAVAALRPHRAARPLCRRELRPPAQALSLLSRRLGVPQRKAGAGPLPPVHAVRRRHGRRGLARPPTPKSA